MSAPPADVTDRLEQLAAHAPRGGIDPDAVWTHGRRRQRVRLGAALAALVAVGALGTTATPLLVERAQRVDPAGSADRMVLPDLVRQPGGWEPEFASAPGRLSAVGLGTRSGLLSDRNAWWGVSARTGESRFLDLPDAPVGFTTQPALSADGRRLAYLVTGEVDEEPVGADGTVGGEPVVGVCVLDLETGRRKVWEVDSPHGLFVGGMAWAGDVLWWTAGPARLVGDGGIAARTRSRTWDLRTADRDDGDSPSRRRVGADGVGHAPGGFVDQGTSRGVELVTGVESEVIRLALPDDAPEGAGTTDTAVSTDGSLLATLLLPDASRYDSAPIPVLVGDLPGRDVALRRLGDAAAETIVGWRSATELVVAGLDEVEEGRPRRVNRAWTLDVRTGERTALLEFSGNTPQLAADALAAEVVQAPDAPFAPDPRLVGLGLLAGAFVVWRVVVRVRGRRDDA
jgi:hypothetical protein